MKAIYRAKTIALMGLLLAMVVMLTTLENMLPPIPLLPPGVKPGLANIVVMYGVFFMHKGQAAILNLLKAVFVLLTRGLMAGLLSFSGGMLAIAVMIILVVIFRQKVSYVAVSVAGAVAHNTGQLAVCAVWMKTSRLLYYLPLLLIFGVVAGVATGVLLKVLLPVLGRIPKD